MDEEELLLQGDDGTAEITDHLDEDQLLNESFNGDAGSTAEESAAAVVKIESVDHEELDYEEEEEKEERESRFTSERAKKSPVRAPEDAASAAAAKPNENTGVAVRGSYRGRVMRGGAGFRGGIGGSFTMRGGMRMGAGGGSAGPISLLTSNIPPPMMMPGPGMGGPFGKILVNPNFPVGAGLTLLPNPGPGGYGAPPMGLRGPMPQVGPKVTLSIDGAPALAVPVNVPRVQPPQMQMGPGPGAPMSMPPPNMAMRPGTVLVNPMSAPPPSAMRFPPGMGPPPMTVSMNVPPPGMVPQMISGAAAGNWNLMVEAFLGDKKAAGGGERSKKKKRRRSRSSSYSSSSGSESSYSESSRSRSRSRSPRRSRKRTSRGSRKTHRKERGSGRGGDSKGERRVFRTGPNSFRINPASSNGSELPSLLDGMDRGSSSSSKDSRARRADREKQRENDSRDSARALGLDDEYLSRVEEQRRQREEMRRRRERNEGGGRDGAGGTDRDRSSNPGSRGRHDSSSNGGGASAKDARGKKPEPAVDESKRKAYLAVHVKNLSNLGEAALGRVKALANEVGETKKVWRSADDVVTVIFVELDKAKAFMLKYNGKVLSGLRITVGLEKVYLNLSEVKDR